MGVIDEVKDRIDIIDLVGESVKLRKSGKNYTGFCPFHPNKRTPAFAVFPDSGTWRCFGACNEGGDIFSFLMKKEGWDFSEALTYLAERAGVELVPQTAEQEAEDESRQRLYELLDAAVAFFRHQLLSTAAGRPALAYLRDRGISDATLETFEIGYAPESWDVIMKHLIGRGFQEQDLVDAGVVSERDSGGLFDRFRHRVMFPIRDVRGRMAGFGARVLDPEAVPKYLNSPQTSIFDKGRLLYGLDKSRQEIRKLDQAVIVEGYMDVIGLHQAGFRNAVSPMGTALTENQLRLLKRYSRRIARAIVQARRDGPVQRTGQLAEIVTRAVPKRPGRRGIHPATRTFQALRVEVNSELENLDALLEKLPGLLSAGGRAAVISFHSLEHRAVKRAFSAAAKEGTHQLLTRKPLTPDADELARNPPSRSAKLRGIERIR